VAGSASSTLVRRGVRVVRGRKTGQGLGSSAVADGHPSRRLSRDDVWEACGTRYAGGEQLSTIRPESEAVVVETPRCFLCGATQDVRFCGPCQRYFCPRCERRYTTRFAAALVEMTRKLSSAGTHGQVLSRLSELAHELMNERPDDTGPGKAPPR
jgi:tRNA(Ile2) C34 agmatinyltransferase TiaS